MPGGPPFKQIVKKNLEAAREDFRKLVRVLLKLALFAAVIGGLQLLFVLGVPWWGWIVAALVLWFLNLFTIRTAGFHAGCSLAG